MWFVVLDFVFERGILTSLGGRNERWRVHPKVGPSAERHFMPHRFSEDSLLPLNFPFSKASHL
jgi:hypothetical protein